MFQVGDRIDDVEIIARLKAGGMAALYLGRRAGAGGFSRQLAVKVIHGHLAGDSSFVEMFVDEARLSARIDHPNVVRVEALKEWQGSYCLLMEFVHGCALSQLMGVLKKRNLRFSPELAVAIAVRVADGLHAAHELLNPDGSAAGVVHRDVSPANVLVGYRGEVKLIDFGIAKATQRLHQTEAAGLKGKIAYMSPEQAFGRDVDRRTDVYALAIVLWEMLTMSRLFKADNDLRLLDMVRDPKLVPPGALVPDMPPALDRVILEALAPDRERRPRSARELRYRLLDALPAAAAIDPLQISAVVCDVMADKIQEEREVLSSSLSLPVPSDRDSITLSRLLRPNTGHGVEVALDQLQADPHELADSMRNVQAPERDAPPTLLPQTSEALADPTTVTTIPRSSRLPLVLGLAGVVGLIVGIGTGVALVLSSAGTAESPTTAQPLGTAPTLVPRELPRAELVPAIVPSVPAASAAPPTPAGEPALSAPVKGTRRPRRPRSGPSLAPRDTF